MTGAKTTMMTASIERCAARRAILPISLCGAIGAAGSSLTAGVSGGASSDGREGAGRGTALGIQRDAVVDVLSRARVGRTATGGFTFCEPTTGLAGEAVLFEIPGPVIDLRKSS